MVFKRIYIFVLILIWSLGTYFYLQEKYNEYTVEVYLDFSVDYKVMREISLKGNTSYHNMNYIITQENGSIIMTSGQDNMFKSIKLIYGDFITHERENVAVIGDRVASDYFRTADAVGRKLMILGEEYLVIGVAEDSWDKYISYKENLLNNKWDHVIYRYQTSNPAHLTIRVRDMNQKLMDNSITYSDMIVYKERMQDYINYIIISVIGLLTIIINRPYKCLKKEVKDLWNKYQEEKIRTEWYKFINYNKKNFFKVGYMVLGVSSFVVAIYYLIKYLEVPQQLLPDNLFSPGSYKDLFQSIYKKWIQRMSKGFTNILADTVIIHLGMLLCLVIHLLVWVYYDKLKSTPWKEEEIED